MRNSLKIAFFGSSLVSAYWNGAATYYRGIIRELNSLGHCVSFYEPDAFERQSHRDIPDPKWARVHVYENSQAGVDGALADASDSDLLVKASGVGVFDAYLESAVLEIKKSGSRCIFWDVDAPATLDRMASDKSDPFRALVPRYDMILTYGGGTPVVQAYTTFGARRCIPIYNALDPSTHFRVEPDQRFSGDLGFLGNRLPDREGRVEGFFFQVAASLPEHRFILGGNGWAGKPKPSNVHYVGHVYTSDHNAFNTTLKAVLNISRDSMARYGYCPATRVFEAAGAAACMITDDWEGIDMFLDPGREVLVAATGREVAEILNDLSPGMAKRIGEKARERVLFEHTYKRRAAQLETLFSE